MHWLLCCLLQSLKSFCITLKAEVTTSFGTEWFQSWSVPRSEKTWDSMASMMTMGLYKMILDWLTPAVTLLILCLPQREWLLDNLDLEVISSNIYYGQIVLWSRWDCLILGTPAGRVDWLKWYAPGTIWIQMDFSRQLVIYQATW